MKPIRFLMIGGFLGAGKTTTIGKLAQHYADQGLNVGLVTNDQAYNLVDTETLRGQGFRVGEVPGACFCCKFDDLMTTVGSLSDASVPDVIIAEPVGSCTDLFATVIQPMRELYGDRFELGPLVVLLKPEHGKKILGVATSGTRRGFSPKAEYIFLKQLEEADAIGVNKIDKLDSETRAGLLKAVQDRFDVPVFSMSARSGEGMEQLISAANSTPEPRADAMEMDYDLYAAGEAELGWLNCQVSARADERFELDQLVLKMVDGIGRRLIKGQNEVAHLKVLGQTMSESSIANLVGSSTKTEISLASEIKTDSADLLVNARVAASPEILKQIVETTTDSLSAELGVELKIGEMQSFRPGRPNPTHRMA